MKALITGASGLLGKYLLKTSPDDVNNTATWFKNLFGIHTNEVWLRLDIRNKDDVNAVFEIAKPDAVIHCAANGSVDYAKSHYHEVHAINVTGTQNIVNAANDYGAKVVYISSNAVYGGNNPPYNELSATEPINDYGSIKMIAERYVRDIAKNWLIIRPFLLYGWPYHGARNNWSNAIIDQLKLKKTFKLVNDNIWMPTYAGDCANTIWQLLNYENQIINVASPERATLYEFGLQICDVFELDKDLLEPVPSSFFSSMAERPKDTTYDLLKLAQAGIMLSDIRTGLEKMRNE